MKQEICVSAPGKIIILGEHAVVYGKLAIIAAIDKRCYVQVNGRKDRKIKIFSNNFKKEILTDFEIINIKFNKAQKDWKAYKQKNDIELLKSITSAPLDYSQIVIGEFINYFFSDIAYNGFDLIINSEIPIGSGMGSSAALAVSIIGALFLYVNKPLDKEKINEIAFLAEQKKHGFPSGGDNTTCCHGGLLWFHKEAADLKIFSQIHFTISPNITNKFLIIFTGQPMESTGELVSVVRNLYQERPEYVSGLFEAQERLVRELLTALKNEDEEKIITIIKNGEKNLERLGVVSFIVKSLIRKIEKKGGAAKICGAGGIAKGSGMLLAYHKDPKVVQRLLGENKYDFSTVTLGTEGVRIEP